MHAAQVVEAVAVLQHFHLRFKNEVKGGTQHAAKLIFPLRQAANPEIDLVEAGFSRGPTSCAGEEVQRIFWRRASFIAKQQEIHRIASAFQSSGIEDQLMLPVGRHKVDNRRRILQEGGKVRPTGIGA